MDNLSLFILIVIILVLFLLTSSSKSCKTPEKLESTINDNFDIDDELLNKAIKSSKLTNSTNSSNSSNINKSNSNKSNLEVLPYFVEMQFHNDYKDVITAFDLLLETGRTIFNRSNLPAKYSSIPIEESNELSNLFITQLNNTMKDKVKDVVDLENGWKNVQANPTIENGWEKQMKQIGLPSNIYDKGSNKGLLKIIRIDKVDLFTTDSQLKFDIYMIIQKMNVADQMVIKVSFVMDSVDLNTDRNFFKNNKTQDLNVHLDEIFIVGFMTNHSYGSKNQSSRQDFYTFENIEKDGITDDKTIINQLKEKYLQYQVESNGLTIQMSPLTGNNLAIERLNEKMPIGPFESTNKL